MPSLTTVTFEKKLDAEGNIIIPYIHKHAFINSGDNNIVFNVPWSDPGPMPEGYYNLYKYTEQVKNADGTYTTAYIDPTGWGAKNYTINYDYVEV